MPTEARNASSLVNLLAIRKAMRGNHVIPGMDCAMQSNKIFGRRAPREQPDQTPPSTRMKFTGRDSEPLLVSLPLPDSCEIVDLDRELKMWKVARKQRKRIFREPWRTLSIAAGIGFGASSWLLPDSVATVAQLTTAGLTAASVVAGIRGNLRAASTALDD